MGYRIGVVPAQECVHAAGGTPRRHYYCDSASDAPSSGLQVGDRRTDLDTAREWHATNATTWREFADEVNEYPRLLGYDQDDSSGDVTIGAGGTAAIDSPSLAFTTDKNYDILVTAGANAVDNATFCVCQVKVIVGWTGGGGGSSTKIILFNSIGAVTSNTLQMMGQRLFSAVPAGDVTIDLEVVDVGSVGTGVRRNTSYPPVTLKAEAIAAVA